MSTYLSRVEHIGDYYNVRPILEMMDGGFVEVDSQKFGQYGTITIAAIYGQYSESPFIQDRKYVMFSLEDEELSQLEKTYSGYKIKAVDFISRCKTLESYRLREVIYLEKNYSFDTFYEWKNEIIADILEPMTALIYLANEGRIIGPFSHDKIEDNKYKFRPATNCEDPYIVKEYSIDEFDEPIYEFDEKYFGKQRHLVFVEELPKSIGRIDCIDDESLKEIASKCMALTSGTKQAQKEVKLAVMGLPETELTEERKKRLLKLFENGEMTNQVISAMPQTILDDPKAMEKIAESILSNSNYTDKIYSIVKSQEHFGDIFSKLDTEKKEKVAEVDALQKKIEILNSQIEDEKNGISTEEVKKLTEENEHLKDELNRHQVYLKLQDNVDNLKQEKSELENEYAQLIKMKDSVSVEIAKKS